MSILIKGMEMPKEGQVIVIVIDSTGQVWLNEWPTRGYVRIDGAKAVLVPPHGRLIDGDELAAWCTENYCWCPCISEIEEAPTIIPAEIENIKPEAEGEWIKMSDTDGIYWACSVCGEDIPRISKFNPQFDLFPRYESIDKTKYCPSCGVKMKNWGD